MIEDDDMAVSLPLIKASWGARAETPAQLADRLLQTIRGLRRLEPVFDCSLWMESILVPGEEENGHLIPLDENPRGLAQAIEHNVCCEDDRNYTPDPDRGYFLFAASGEGREPNYIHFCASAAGIDSSYVTPFIHSASIGFSINGARHDLLTFDTVKSLLLIVAEAWEASSGFASASHSFDMALTGKGFKWGWMTYLSPSFARLIVEPPCDTILEHRPNGGLFMAAMTEVYDPANPVHYDAALAIRDALAPLNDLENPIDQPYR